MDFQEKILKKFWQLAYYKKFLEMVIVLEKWEDPMQVFLPKTVHKYVMSIHANFFYSFAILRYLVSMIYLNINKSLLGAEILYSKKLKYNFIIIWTVDSELGEKI
jgi:hypothetical protein